MEDNKTDWTTVKAIIIANALMGKYNPPKGGEDDKVLKSLGIDIIEEIKKRRSEINS